MDAPKVCGISFTVTYSQFKRILDVRMLADGMKGPSSPVLLSTLDVLRRQQLGECIGNLPQNTVQPPVTVAFRSRHFTSVYI